MPRITPHLADLPASVKGAVFREENGDYSVYINQCCSSRECADILRGEVRKILFSPCAGEALVPIPCGEEPLDEALLAELCAAAMWEREEEERLRQIEVELLAIGRSLERELEEDAARREQERDLHRAEEFIH